MSLSDRFKSMMNKGKAESSRPESDSTRAETPASSTPPQAAVPTPTPAPASRTLEEIDRLLIEERRQGETQLQSVSKEIQTLRMALEKTEMDTKTRRESQDQTLQFLQQDAEREIKFLERKLNEDTAAWNRQLNDREKALEKATHQVESGQLEQKQSYEQAESTQKDALVRTEDLLKEQEAKLSQERQKWRDLLQTKDAEMLQLKQELTRREGDLENELQQQEVQRKAAHDLWQTRLKELERQWGEKRKAWEDAMKAKEEERARLQASFHERQAAWQLDHERRLQEINRRHERANEKVSALKAHHVKETQTWQQLLQSREEQLQQLKVKLLLSESDTKGRLEQAQKVFQETVATTAAQVQALHNQLRDEKKGWQDQLAAKEAEMAGLKEDLRIKIRQIETDFTTRLEKLRSEKEDLTGTVTALEAQFKEEQARCDERIQALKAEQVALEGTHQARMLELKKRGDEEGSTLQAQIVVLEKQKDEAIQQLEHMRLRWQEELVQKEQALKEAQTALAPQETELRKKYSGEEETLTRQVDGLKSRVRAIERDLARARESLERVERDHAAAIESLERDSREKEESLQRRTQEVEERLRKRLEERRLALDAFLAMKKDEETRLQTLIKSKEKERADLAARLKNLPAELAKELEDKKASTKREADALRLRIQTAETELAQAREEAKTLIQAKATQLASLRQTLEAHQKEMAADQRGHEQMLESERAAVEKQLSTAQAEMDRVRVHWQEEINRKEQEAAALLAELKRQEALQRQTLDQERKALDAQSAPLLEQRDRLTGELEALKLDHQRALHDLEAKRIALETETEKARQQGKLDREGRERVFQETRARWKAELEGLRSEREGYVQSSQQALEDKTRQIEQLEEQLRAQAVAHEARRRDLIHSATLKTRTIQDIIQQVQTELQTSQANFPQEMKAREETLARLHQELEAVQAAQQQAVARLERATATLRRRGQQKDESLRHELAAAKEEWSKRLAAKDGEITALQSTILEKESERQGELDRLAKQFAEERFQLEKSKEELEWKLKDHKEVSERQISTKQKEIQFLENELTRLKDQRDQQIAEKTTAFEAEKQKTQAALAALQRQGADERETAETTLGAKDQELQTLLSRSKERLKVLGEEFNQKVNSWRGTNDALRAQIDQLKGHVTQAQDHWEALRKEKGNEVARLRQSLTDWEVKVKNDTDAIKHEHEQERQRMLGALHTQERNVEEERNHLQKRLADKDDEMARSLEQIKGQESAAEAQWHATLEQWQRDKQTLQEEKVRLEQSLIDLQARSEQDIRQSDEAGAKLRMDIAFIETQSASLRDRLQAQNEKELQPLRDRLEHLQNETLQERTMLEGRLRSKDDDLRLLKSRLAAREKRLQDEIKRREKEISDLRSQLETEVAQSKQRFEAERTRLETLTEERRRALQLLQERERQLGHVSQKAEGAARQTLDQERQQLEESLKVLAAQRDQNRLRLEALLQQREGETLGVREQLNTREADLEGIRAKARETMDGLRKQLEQLRQSSKGSSSRQGPTNAGAWKAFETGIHFYQAHQWAEAARYFETCLEKDPHWGAAYQYLALTYHAQGNVVEAYAVAARALQEDPGNVQLGTWVDRLRADMDQRKAS